MPPTTVRIIAGASLVTTLGALPPFLVGAQAVVIARDLALDPARLGVVVATFFGAAALGAVLGGGLVDRVGRRWGLVLAGALVSTGGLGLALLARSWWALVAAMVVLGLANAACQVTSNLAMASAIPSGRRGLGFGVKQAAVPTAILIGGLAVPTVTLTLGWRATFLATGTAGLLVLVAGLLGAGRDARPPRRVSGLDRPATAPLVVIAVSITLASAAANSLGTFLAGWAHQAGLTVAEAGLLLAAGSVCSIVVRVIVGHRADRRHGANLPRVAAMMAVGAAGLTAVSFPSLPPVLLGALAAFAVGWAWPGLLLFAVARLGRDTPALASGVVQAGAFVGGALGPALFGVTAGGLGYPVAWRLAAGCFLAAAVLALVARRMFRTDLRARPPREPLGYGGGREQPLYWARRPADDAGGQGAATPPEGTGPGR